jgi:hypothetical protein
MITHCTFNGAVLAGTVGVTWVASGGLRITSCKFIHHATSIQIAPRAGCNTSDILITGSSIEGFSSTGITFSSANAGTLVNMLVTGNELAAAANLTYILFQNTSGTLQRFTVSSNVFALNAGGVGVNVLNSVSGGNIFGNFFAGTSSPNCVVVDSSCSSIGIYANQFTGVSLPYNIGSTTTTICSEEGAAITFANLPSAAGPGSRIYCTDAKGVGDAGYSAMMVAASGGTGAWLHRKGTTWYAL